MASSHPRSRNRLDRFGITLSGLCAVHCILGIVLVAGLGLGGEVLLDPSIHHVGLILAIIVAGATIGVSAVRHRRAAPVVLASIGLICMGAALLVGHGVEEAVLTVIGVVLVAAGHFRNLRCA